MSIVLRDYQEAAIEAVRDKLREGHKRVILSAPTGAGKTEIAMALIQAAVNKGSRVSFIADRRSLVNQTSRRFNDAGIVHGILMGNDTHGTNMRVRVESAQTIQRRGLRDSDLFVMDEVHEIRGDILKMIADSGATLIGLTATPFPKGLAEPIDAHLPAKEQKEDSPLRWEAMVSTTTTDSLIAQGHLCPFDVIAPESVVDTSGLKTDKGEFHRPSLAKRILRIVGDIIPTWRGVIEDRYGGEMQPTIVFGSSVDDSEAIQRVFRNEGYNARLVSSREDDEQNKRVIDAFRDGEFDVLVNCAMLSRGADFPRATILVDAYPMRKILTPIQRYGRVMRMFLGKEKATLIDHAENWLHMRDHILAFYTSGPSWPPPEHANKNARKKKIERDSICKSCRTVIPPGDEICPGCGKERAKRKFGGKGCVLKRVDGNLKLIDSVTGEVSFYGGDLWPEVCTTVLDTTKGDFETVKKRALASYKSITGKWPNRDFEFLDRKADPAVADLVRRNFQAWLIARRAKEAVA